MRSYEIEDILRDLADLGTRLSEKKTARVSDWRIIRRAERIIEEMSDTKKVEEFVEIMDRVHVMARKDQDASPIYRKSENGKNLRLRIRMMTGDIVEVMTGWKIRVHPRAANVIWIDDEGEGLEENDA